MIKYYFLIITICFTSKITRGQKFLAPGFEVGLNNSFSHVTSANSKIFQLLPAPGLNLFFCESAFLNNKTLFSIGVGIQGDMTIMSNAGFFATEELASTISVKKFVKYKKSLFSVNGSANFTYSQNTSGIRLTSGNAAKTDLFISNTIFHSGLNVQPGIGISKYFKTKKSAVYSFELRYEEGFRNIMSGDAIHLVDNVILQEAHWVNQGDRLSLRLSYFFISKKHNLIFPEKIHNSMK